MHDRVGSALGDGLGISAQHLIQGRQGGVDDMTVVEFAERFAGVMGERDERIANSDGLNSRQPIDARATKKRVRKIGQRVIALGPDIMA